MTFEGYLKTAKLASRTCSCVKFLSHDYNVVICWRCNQSINQSIIYV